MKTRKPAHIALFVASAAVSLVILIPFAMILISSVKNARESALFSLSWPKEFVWKNYAVVLSKPAVLRGFLNTLFIGAVTVLLTDIFAAMAAFVIQRRPGRFSRAAYLVFFLGLIVPVSIIPTIRLMMGLGLHNTYQGIILYYIAVNLPFSIFLLTGFMKTIPKELDESALLEGCGYLRMFFQIVMPLLMTVIVTTTIVVSIAVWDDFFGSFYLVSDFKKWTIMISIYSFVSQYQTNWGVVFAFMMLVMAPMLIVYFSLQRYIIDGLTAGSLKG